MQKYRPMAVASMLDSIQHLQGQIDALQRELKSQNEWYKRFEGILDRHSDQIGELLQGLKSEVTAREKGEDTLTRTLSDYSIQFKSWDKAINRFKGALLVIGLLLGALLTILAPILTKWIMKLFSP